MTLFQSIILGIIQGLTEFLPISSSGHLVIIPFFLGWEFPDKDAFVFNVLVQVATLVAVFAYFWKDILEIGRVFLKGLFEKKPFATQKTRLGWYILLATIPAGVIGLALKDQVESAFNSPTATGIFLLGTAGLLVAAERVGKRNRNLEKMNWKDAIWIGFFQALAIFPGISRSGATIVGGMTRDLKRDPAARFSFLISIPVMLAAGLLSFIDLFEIPNLAQVVPVFLPGFLAAAVIGYLSIRWLLGFLLRHSLYAFAVYCVIVGIATLIFARMG